MVTPWKVYTPLYLLLLLTGVVSTAGKKTPSSRRAAFHFDESLINIWPLPKQFTFGNRTLTVDPDLVLDVQGFGGNSTIVAEAFERFRNVVFKQQSGFAGGEFDISKITIVLASDDEQLQLGVDESYALYVSEGSGGGGGGKLSIVGGTSIEVKSFKWNLDYDIGELE